ncbi:hypothetical protein JOM56_001603 [Amanita muscaria]
MLPPQVGFIVGLFVQAILYGTYIATLLHGLRWHLYEDEGRSKVKRAMTIVAIVIFMFSTIDLGIMVPMVLGRGPRALPVISAVIESVIIHVVDAVLIYRCWVIHGRAWRIVCLPLALWCSCLVFMSLDIYYQFMAIDLPVPEQVKHFRCAFFACHIATNVFATSASCYRISRVVKQNRSFTTSNRISKIGCMLAWSDVLFMLTSILNLIFGLIGFVPNLILFQVTFNAINFSIAGITFNFIIMYVGEQRAKTAVDSSGSFQTENQKALSTLQFRTHNATVPYDSSCNSSDYTASP